MYFKIYIENYFFSIAGHAAEKWDGETKKFWKSVRCSKRVDVTNILTLRVYWIFWIFKIQKQHPSEHNSEFARRPTVIAFYIYIIFILILDICEYLGEFLQILGFLTLGNVFMDPTWTMYCHSSLPVSSSTLSAAPSMPGNHWSVCGHTCLCDITWYRQSMAHKDHVDGPCAVQMSTTESMRGTQK